MKIMVFLQSIILFSLLSSCNAEQEMDMQPVPLNFNQYVYAHTPLTGQSVMFAGREYQIKPRDVLLAPDYRNQYGGGEYTSEEWDVLEKVSEKYFAWAGIYDFGVSYNYRSLELIEVALSIHTAGIYYYHYGVCLMDIQEYDNAEKAFIKATKYFEGQSLYGTNFGIDPPKRQEFFSYDENGAAREIYFSWYNLSCIYSIKNEFEKSFQYLTKALEWGYPYISNIMNDEDLTNLFQSDGAIKDRIKAIYDAGFNNTLARKAYEQWVVNDVVLYCFFDDELIIVEYLTSDDRDHKYHGSYEIKNYQILINYSRETGRKGEGPLPGGGTITPYKNYISYDKKIDRIGRISIMEIVENYWKNWEEKPFDNYYFD
jgi:tetratricopeptide (TPR) repeat protein